MGHKERGVPSDVFEQDDDASETKKRSARKQEAAARIQADGKGDPVLREDAAQDDEEAGENA